MFVIKFSLFFYQESLGASLFLKFNYLATFFNLIFFYSIFNFLRVGTYSVMNYKKNCGGNEFMQSCKCDFTLYIFNAFV